MLTTRPQKIAIIGNAGGGKTTLSRKLAKSLLLPLTHVDAIQFLTGMKMRPLDESRSALLAITSQEKWIIDGFGPLDLIEKRFQTADLVIFIDFPIWRHVWWCTKRQIRSLWWKREELPEGCHEGTWGQTVKLYKTLMKVHRLMRPELIRILERENLKGKVLLVRNLKDWNLASRGELEFPRTERAE
jgi:adenylate kinase family enzyme